MDHLYCDLSIIFPLLLSNIRMFVCCGEGDREKEREGERGRIFLNLTAIWMLTIFLAKSIWLSIIWSIIRLYLRPKRLKFSNENNKNFEQRSNGVSSYSWYPQTRNIEGLLPFSQCRVSGREPADYPLSIYICILNCELHTLVVESNKLIFFYLRDSDFKSDTSFVQWFHYSRSRMFHSQLMVFSLLGRK